MESSASTASNSTADPEQNTRAPSKRTSSALNTKASDASDDMKTQKSLKYSEPPSHASEIIFLMMNLFLLKFYSEMFFDAMTFFNISVPMMIYLVFTLFLTLIEFMKQLALEEKVGVSEEDEGSIISPK